MKVKITPTYDEMLIDIPVSGNIPSAFAKGDMADLWKSKVTIFNDIQTTAEQRHFDRFVINDCNIQGGHITKTDGTIQNIVNAKTVISKDIEHYKPPEEYIKLTVDEREHYYTAQVGDFVVLAEVEDIIKNALEFSQLQTKYKNNGFKIMTVTPYIYGMSVDNVTMTNV